MRSCSCDALSCCEDEEPPPPLETPTPVLDGAAAFSLAARFVSAALMRHPIRASCSDCSARRKKDIDIRLAESESGGGGGGKGAGRSDGSAESR